jgi:hypothetical protein
MQNGTFLLCCATMFKVQVRDLAVLRTPELSQSIDCVIVDEQ